MLLKNTTPRIFNLPLLYSGEKKTGQAFGNALIIAPGATADVPDWYVAELKKIRVWQTRINERGEITQSRRLGTIAPEDRPQAKKPIGAEELAKRVADLETRHAPANVSVSPPAHIDESKRVSRG